MDQPVKITDVDMKFTSMVVFMVKWAVASIPAMLIVLVMGGLVAVAFASCVGAASLAAAGHR